MAINDPIGAVDKHLEIEKLADDPVLERVAGLVESLRDALGITWPITAAAESLLGRLAADRVAKIELAVQAIKDELRRHENKINNLSQDANRLSEWMALVVDGLKKAEQTRARSRVERIGLILANSLVIIPFSNADYVEEMTRTAMDISDDEWALLNELVRIQGKIVEQHARTPRFDAWQSWVQGSWGNSVDGTLTSAFNKLESYGLVSRVPPPNNFNIQADLQNRYALLKKGLDFIRLSQRQ